MFLRRLPVAVEDLNKKRPVGALIICAFAGKISDRRVK